MTAKMFSAFDYGMHEMPGLYRRHASIALAIAVLFHLAIVSIYYLLSPFFQVQIIHRQPVPGIPPIDINWKFPTQQTVIGSIGKKHINISSEFKFAIPKPVAIDESMLKEKFAPQEGISDPPFGGSEKGTEGAVFGDEGLGIVPGTEAEPSPSEIVLVERLPIPVRQVAPEYPAVARLAGLEGTVLLRVLIDKQGKPKKAIVWKSDAEVFDEPAMKAALQWVFTPAMMNSGPVTVWVSIPFRFKLNN